MFRLFLYSLTGRFFLILLGGTIVSGALALALAAYEGRDVLDQLRNRHLTERIEQVILTLDATPPSSRQKITEIAEKSGIRIDLPVTTALTNHVDDAALTASLQRLLGQDRQISAYRRYGSSCPVRSQDENAIDNGLRNKCRTILTTLNDGTALRIDVPVPSDRLPLPFRPDFLPYLVLFLICVAALAFFVAKLATKHIRVLAEAAHGLGRNLEQPRLPENKGPYEVREAASAFNSMQSQIRHFIQERTYMLAAIAHDL
ncbi:MAG TPA: HAMP domain-containing protein, partial [Methylophilaceae bacterium]|nr:HAMP domain-containing protein [Methylophilaceae bacterium]